MDTITRDISVAILVEPDFIPTELALAKDVFRIANRLSQTFRFTTCLWTLCGEELVEGVGGLWVRACSVPDTAQPEHVVVLGGFGVAREFARIRACVRRLEQRGCKVLLLSDASSEWKRLNPAAQEVTTHWENHQLLCDTNAMPGTPLPLYSRSKRITSGAGMMATADVLLLPVDFPLAC